MTFAADEAINSGLDYGRLPDVSLETLAGMVIMKAWGQTRLPNLFRLGKL
jgi:hypothetical protein